MEKETNFTERLRSRGFEPMAGWHAERHQAASKAAKQSTQTLITKRKMKPSEKELPRFFFRVWRKTA